VSDAHRPPLVLVIFGITGDLAQRKLIPALYNLFKHDELTRNLQIVGISRRDVDISDVYGSLHKYIGDDEVDSTTMGFLVEHTEMVAMDLTDSGAYRNLLDHLQEVEQRLGEDAARLYYLSIPPQMLNPIIRLLGATGHNAPLPGMADIPRLLVEKPFGYDSASAKDLIGVVDEHFNEKQVYRIDHYIAKETVQNILTFRFQNPLFQAVWDKQHIVNISVVAHEKIGIEGRVTFYEQTGALRDLIQSHLLQLLSFVTMAKPVRMDSDAIHAKKLQLLRAVSPIAANEVSSETVRGQYDGYRQEVNNPHSNIETYARINLRIDDEKWRDVPITLEAGKAMAEKITEITVCFSDSPDGDQTRNKLIFRIQPDEGITILLQVKRPGVDNHTQSAKMSFTYQSSFSERQADAYERVLIDAVRGDQTLFASAEEVLASWDIVENVIHEWAKNDTALIIYPQGSDQVD
jgi:glucose-6-phosphate 1-dehydrogenase